MRNPLGRRKSALFQERSNQENIASEKVVKKKLTGKGKTIVLNQIDNFYKLDSKYIEKTVYKENELVELKKGTLLHGTYKNLGGLKNIVKNGLIASWFVGERDINEQSKIKS